MLESILPRFLYGSSPSPSADATSNAASDADHKPVVVAAGRVACCMAEDKDMDDEWIFLAPATTSASTTTTMNKSFSKAEATRAAVVVSPGRSYADVVAGRDKKEE